MIYAHWKDLIWRTVMVQPRLYSLLHELPTDWSTHQLEALASFWILLCGSFSAAQ